MGGVCRHRSVVSALKAIQTGSDPFEGRPVRAELVQEPLDPFPLTDDFIQV